MVYARGGEGSGLGVALLSAGTLALGLVLGASILGGGIVQARLVDQRVTVKGLAEREVKADLALWPVTVTASGDDLALLQEKVESDVQLLTNFLTGAGFDEAEVSLGRLQMEDRIAHSWGADLPSGGRYLINQPITVRTTNVDLVAERSRALGEIVRQGVVITGWQGPSYIFTGLNDIKPDMVAEATAEARESADKFAADADARLGGIRTANQGVFEIRPRDATPGASESDQIFKTVRVVATITYFLED